MLEGNPKLKSACANSLFIIGIGGFLGIAGVSQLVGRAVLNDWKHMGSFGTEYFISVINTLLSILGVSITFALGSVIENLTCLPLGQLLDRIPRRALNPIYSKICFFTELGLGNTLTAMALGYVDQALRSPGSKSYDFTKGPVHTYWTTLAVGMAIVPTAITASLMFYCSRRAPVQAGAAAPQVHAPQIGALALFQAANGNNPLSEALRSPSGGG